MIAVDRYDMIDDSFGPSITGLACPATRSNGWSRSLASERPTLFYSATICCMNLDQLKARLVFYPTLWWNMLLGRWLKVRNWWDPIDQNVVVGAYPFASDVPALAEMGIGGVVNTCEEYEGPVEQYRKFGIEQLWIPTTDFTHPRLEDVKRAMEFIDDQVSRGRRVYIHCKAGRARSATIALCWLMRDQGLSAEEAQQLLLDRRSHVNPRS